MFFANGAKDNGSVRSMAYRQAVPQGLFFKAWLKGYI
jgi:hypothetical protein